MSVCLRCGHCCMNLAVIIVNDPKLGIREDNLIPVGINGPERCRHLQGDAPGEYSCAIHGYEWYEETPCAAHNSEWSGECRMGAHIIKHQGSATPER